jgi:tRNA-splicing endonuclease subunit Sen34
LKMDAQPALPIPISLITQRYLLFDIAAVSYLRREHNICGVLIGSIPQSPSQNLFLGLPLELMPEEAQLLIAKGVAYTVDDARAHDEMLHEVDLARREKYIATLRQEGQTVWKTRSMQKEQAFRKKVLRDRTSKSSGESPPGGAFQDADDTPIDDTDSVFSAALSALDVTKSNFYTVGVTPATSTPLLHISPTSIALGDAVPQTYPLFKHLHDRGYFLSPGLRFGCQYMAYPGDPLRYHSHFLVDGKKWDDAINLMDIVGGGRLGTGVKKAYLLGGTDPEGQVKTFSIEWAGM